MRKMFFQNLIGGISGHWKTIIRWLLKTAKETNFDLNFFLETKSQGYPQNLINYFKEA